MIVNYPNPRAQVSLTHPIHQMTCPDQEQPQTPQSCDSNDAPATSDENDELEVLLFETSAYGNVHAIVQHDQRSLYFYLQPKSNEFPARACWVRNLVPGPYVINQDDLLAGRQVVLPRAFGKSGQAGRLPQPTDLSIVWFEEGNGAALLESNSGNSKAGGSPEKRILAIIPPWSGQDGFHGYAAECAMDSPICWPLPKNPRLQQRVELAAAFWSSFLQPPDPFIVLRDQLLAVYRTRFGVDSAEPNEQQYFSINGNQFPPRGMIQYRLTDSILLLTVGMSLCPQPNVELSIPEPQQCRRIELAIELPVSIDIQRLDHARQQVAKLAGYPWRNFRWLGVGHTCEFSGVFQGSNSVRLNQTSPQLGIASAAVETTNLLTFHDDPINLLWLEPVT